MNLYRIMVSCLAFTVILGFYTGWESQKEQAQNIQQKTVLTAQNLYISSKGLRNSYVDLNFLENKNAHNWPVLPGDIEGTERHLYGVSHHSETLSDEAKEKIAAYFSVIEGSFTKEDMNDMRQLNPDLKFIRYINSTYTTSKNDDEMHLIEGEYRDGIEMFLAAELASDIPATTNEFILKPVNGAIRLRASTVSGNLSKSTKQYVIWIRIGDEIMHIDLLDTISGRIHVTRGFAGTIMSAHPAGSHVFSPIYIGYLGWPGYPGAEEEINLRYALSVSNEHIYEYKAKILLENMIEYGYDGAKFDILANVWYNMCDALGKQVYPWDFQNNELYTVHNYLRQQERKIAFIQNYIFDKIGRYPVLFGNSLSHREFYPKGGGAMYFMMRTDITPRPMDGFQMENFVSVVTQNRFPSPGFWEEKISMLMYAARHDMGSVALIQFSDLHNKYGHFDPIVLQHEMYGYASYLMGIEAEETTYVGTPVFMELPENNKQVVELFPQYFYKLGNPAESKEKVEMYKRSEVDIFERRYEHGLVMVNPSNESFNNLGLTQKYYDPDVQQYVKSVSLTAHTGKILLDRPPAR